MKPAWVRWPDWCMALYGLGTVGVGLIGLTYSPSPSLEDGYGRVIVTAVSALYIGLGVVAAGGAWKRNRTVSVWAMVGLSLLSVVQGVGLIVAGSDMVGLRFLITPFLMVPGVLAWDHWMRERERQQLAAALMEAATDHA